MFVLDTNHIGIIQRRSEPGFSRFQARWAKYSPTAFYFPIISIHEEFLGWNAYINKARKIEGVIKGYRHFTQMVIDFQATQVLPFDDAAARSFFALRQQGVRIGVMDLRIAAIAFSRSMTVLTQNKIHFLQVPGLKVEDWTVE